MILRTVAIGFLVACGSVAMSVTAPRLDDVWGMEKDLQFDDLFPRRSYFGKTARVQGFSHDDRYVAYLWNEREEPGNDLYLYDTRSNKSMRLTTPDLFREFDRDIDAKLKTHEEDEKRRKEWEKLSDSEYRVKRQERKEKPPRGQKRYGGPSTITWANEKNEFLMTYLGDVYRWKLGQDKPTRLTWTRDNESGLQYLPDDSGFVYRRGNDAYKMTWDSPAVIQLNPTLPNGISMNGYRISPDGKQMLVFGSRVTAPTRQVDWIVYRDRFAEARKTTRGVADDNFNSETRIYLFDITDEALLKSQKEPKAFEIWKFPGGEEFQETSISSNPWSPDGSRFTFVSWKRDKKELELWEVDLNRKKTRSVYRGTSEGEHRTPSLASPFYTHDGKHIVIMLDKSGWRHMHLIERIYGEEKQVTSGDFEVYPQELSSDGKSVIVLSSKENLARRDYYRVSLEDNSMERLTEKDGRYSVSAKANNSDKMTATFNSWSDLRDLYLLDGNKEVQITDSNDEEAFFENIKIKPELFTYNNRHGDTIHGYMFKPKGYESGPKRPLFIYVYGGPLGTGNSVADGSFQSTGFMFNMYLAHTLGYVTCVVDPRGQSGYSAAFGRANWERVGEPQTEDLTDLVKYMTANHNADASKVGLTGWSFGGFQTQHAMYNEPDVFTLGIAGAGPTEWQNYNTWYSGGVIGNARKGKPEDLDKYSLTNTAKNLKNPLMLLHGIEDTNVLFQDTVMVYRKLLQAGKGPLVELALDPTGGHGMGGDMDTRDRHMIYLAFIIKHWGLPTYMSTSTAKTGS